MTRTTKVLAALAVLLAVLAAGPALAHEAGGDRAQGVVASVAPDRVAIRASDGHVVEFAVTPGTRFSRGKDVVRAEDVRVGARAVARGARKGGALIAVEVRLSPPAP